MTSWRYRRGGQIAFVTFSQSHGLGDDLAVLMRKMSAGTSQAFRLSPADRDLYGLRGYEHVSEIAHGFEHGWNPHRHGIVFLDRPLSGSELLRLADHLAEGFIHGIRGQRGKALPLGQKIEPVNPGDEKTMAEYCFKGTTKWSKTATTRTPLAIAYDYTATGSSRDAALLRELAEAVDATRISKRRNSRLEQDRTRGHGLRHFTTSPRLDALCGCDQPHPTAA